MGDGFDVTVTAEDVAGTITLDNINLEAEDTTGSGGLMKLISSSGGNATLSVEATGAIVNQDTTSDADVTFNTVQLAGNEIGAVLSISQPRSLAIPVKEDAVS